MPSQMDVWNKSNPFQRLVLAQHIPSPELHPTQMELKVWCVTFYRDPSPRKQIFFFLATGNKCKQKLLLLCGRCTQKKAAILCQRVCTVAQSCSGVLILIPQLLEERCDVNAREKAHCLQCTLSPLDATTYSSPLHPAFAKKKKKHSIRLKAKTVYSPLCPTTNTTGQ